MSRDAAPLVPPVGWMVQTAMTCRRHVEASGAAPAAEVPLDLGVSVWSERGEEEGDSGSLMQQAAAQREAIKLHTASIQGHV
ncbi:hypothetical protein MHYP_G00154170 [Metynnis hypsauchen]